MSKATKHTLEIYDKVSNKISELEIIRDHQGALSEPELWTSQHEELHKILHEFFDKLRKLQSFYAIDNNYFDMSEEERIGQQIKLMRNKRGLTVKELAKEVGVSERTINNIESGSVKSSTLKVLAYLYNDLF